MMDQVQVVGPQARSFLQGQLSQDMARVDRDGAAWAWILQPTGKVDALVHVVHSGDDAYRLDVDAGFGEAVVARLSRFKLRTKAEITLLAEQGSVSAFPDERARIEAGWPAMGNELTPDSIPNETGLIPLTVSFTKGCYTGQELVARIDSRGNNVPKRLMRLRSEQPMPVGDDLVVDGKVVGSITSSSGTDAHRYVALAYVARSVEAGAPMSCAGATVCGETIEHG